MLQLIRKKRFRYLFKLWTLELSNLLAGHFCFIRISKSVRGRFASLDKSLFLLPKCVNVRMRALLCYTFVNKPEYFYSLFGKFTWSRVVDFKRLAKRLIIGLSIDSHQCRDKMQFSLTSLPMDKAISGRIEPSHLLSSTNSQRVCM